MDPCLKVHATSLSSPHFDSYLESRPEAGRLFAEAGPIPASEGIACVQGVYGLGHFQEKSEKLKQKKQDLNLKSQCHNHALTISSVPYSLYSGVRCRAQG